MLFLPGVFGTATRCSAFVSTGQFNPEVDGSGREGTSAQKNLDMYFGDPCWKFPSWTAIAVSLGGLDKSLETVSK